MTAEFLKDYSDYIEISRKLMNDEIFFKNVVSKIKKNKKIIFESKINFYSTIKSYL